MKEENKESGLWWKVLIVLVAVAFVWINPALKAIVIWILPLGSGPDDIAGIILIALFVGWVLISTANKVLKHREESQKEVEVGKETNERE